MDFACCGQNAGIPVFISTFHSQTILVLWEQRTIALGERYGNTSSRFCFLENIESEGT